LGRGGRGYLNNKKEEGENNHQQLVGFSAIPLRAGERGNDVVFGKGIKRQKRGVVLKRDAG